MFDENPNAYIGDSWDPTPDITTAANIANSTNPPYTTADFLESYPQFSVMPPKRLARYLAIANAVVLSARWADLWEEGMDLYMGHKCVLYLRRYDPTAIDCDAAADTGIADGLTTLNRTAETDIRFDHKEILKGIDGGGEFLTTSFGRDFLSHARLIGLGGAFII